MESKKKPSVIANDINTLFKIRSENYENEASWISDENFILPLVPNVFGTEQLLDACCGTGIISEHCKKAAWDVLAVDISPDMLKRVNKSIKCLVADIQELPLPDKSFDASVCRQGLQYVNLSNGLRSLMRVTKSEIRLGHITINDQADAEFWTEYFSISAPCRRNVFIPGQIEEQAGRLGLELIDEKIVTIPESLLGPIQHLDQETQNNLLKRVIDNTEDFKKRNNVELVDGQLYSNRRWEFLTFKVN